MKNIKKTISVGTEKQITFHHVITATATSDFTLHLHNEVELFVYVSGDVDFMIEDQYIVLQPGTVILAKENVLHKPIIKTARPYERFYLTLPRDTFLELCQGKDPLSFLEKEVSILSLNQEAFRNLLSLLNAVSDVSTRQGFEDYYLIFAYLLLMMKLLNDHVEEQAEETAGGPIKYQARVPDLVQKVLNYVDLHAHEIHSVKELAEIFYVNPSYLSGLFSKATKINLKHYLTVKKVAISKELLQQDKSVTEVAYYCGFSSCSHFITVFKKYTGQTPDEYRRIVGVREIDRNGKTQYK